jgi:hypothetical protein
MSATCKKQNWKQKPKVTVANPVKSNATTKPTVELVKPKALVTIDSNWGAIPGMIAYKMSPSPKAWCFQTDQCPQPTASPYNIYYNTPVSMSSDLTKYNLPADSLHFIYLDYNYINAQLRRLVRNYGSIKPIIISNASVVATGKYHLLPGNCSVDFIATILANLISLHVRFQRLISAKVLQDYMISGKEPVPVGPMEPATAVPVVINAYQLARAVYDTKGGDCRDCSVCPL